MPRTDPIIPKELIEWLKANLYPPLLEPGFDRDQAMLDRGGYAVVELLEQMYNEQNQDDDGA